MNPKIDNLLAVLDMTEDERWSFLCSHQGIQEMCNNQLDVNCQKKYKRMVLADLAFLLRDKVLALESGTTKWVMAMFDVYMKMTGSKLLNWKWGYVVADPIHWVVAALIVLAKEEKND